MEETAPWISTHRKVHSFDQGTQVAAARGAVVLVASRRTPAEDQTARVQLEHRASKVVVVVTAVVVASAA